MTAPVATSVRAALDAAKAEGRTILTPSEARAICDAYGIPLPKDATAASGAEAARLAAEFGYPVVLKIVSPDITHKTDVGGVIAGLANEADVLSAYDTIIANAKRNVPGARITGVLVQQMLVGGVEVIVGAVTDPSFGKLVAFGLGGILVEILKDITFRLAPLTNDSALSMLDSIKASALLAGVRGSAAGEVRVTPRAVVCRAL